MRASWTGAIHFGLVSIPVRLFRAVEEPRVRFRYLHCTCRTPLLTQRYCPYHEHTVPWQEVIRGYEIAPDQFIVVEREEIERARPERERARRIDIQAFVDLGEIEPIYYHTSYHAEPLEEGRPAYALLQQAMRQTARAAVAQLILRGRETLAAIRPYGDALLVQTLFYADQVRPTTTLDLPREAATPRELRTAIRLIENMAEPFRARLFTDEYHRRLMSLIEERIPALAGPPPARPELVEELEASIDAVGESRRAGR